MVHNGVGKRTRDDTARTKQRKNKGADRQHYSQEKHVRSRHTVVEKGPAELKLPLKPIRKDASNRRQHWLANDLYRT